MTRRVLTLYLEGTPSQLLEKVGIFFDIARLTVRVILSYGARIKERTVLVHRILASQIAIIIILSAVDIFLEVEMIENRTPGDDEKMHKIIVANSVNIIILTLQSNLGIIIAYLTIYIVLLRTYLKSRTFFPPSIKSAMRLRMVLLMILFLTICQMYVVRIFRDIEYATEFEDNVDSHYLATHICKIIQVTGICLSLYISLKTNKHKDREVSSTLARLTDSLFEYKRTSNELKDRPYSVNINTYDHQPSDNTYEHQLSEQFT